MQKLKSWSRIVSIFTFLLLILVSCSKEDKLVGTWDRSLGLGDDYTQYRRFYNSEYPPTCFHTFTFEKGEDGEKGTFTDAVSPLVLPTGDTNPDQLIVGSKITGEWEIKGKKLYLFYDDDLKLLNADNLSSADQSRLKDEMTAAFLKEYKQLGEEGFPYEIVKKDKGESLKIAFGNTDLVFKLNEDK